MNGARATIFCIIAAQVLASGQGARAGECLDGCDCVPFDCGDAHESLLSNLIGPEGLIKPSDHQFDHFISPVTNPVYFEDPRTLTEARFIFMNQRIPEQFGGNAAQVYALQLRAALTENLSLIATKDGFIVSQNPLLDDGWADVALGLKWNVWKDPEAQRLISLGTTFKLPAGSHRSLQGTGDGEFNLFASGGMEFLNHFHYLTTSGFRLPDNTNKECQVWYWSNHLDWRIRETGFYLFGESNWYHYMRSGQSFPVPVEGLDLINLGAVGMAGKDIVTGAVGVKYKPSGHVEIGLAWEAPMTVRHDLMTDRLTADLILRY